MWEVPVCARTTRVTRKVSGAFVGRGLTWEKPCRTSRSSRTLSSRSLCCSNSWEDNAGRFVLKRRDFMKAVGVSTLGGAMLSATGGVQAGSDDAGSSQTEHEIAWTRRVPVRYTADVVVIGGGIAGVSAACAAAKTGANE